MGAERGVSRIVPGPRARTFAVARALRDQRATCILCQQEHDAALGTERIFIVRDLAICESCVRLLHDLAEHKEI